MTSVCDIWLADLRPETAADLALLNDVELRRRAEYEFGDDRARFTLGVVLSRRAAANVLALDPRSVDIDRTCARCGAPHGKPIIPRSGLHLSVSHSAELVAVALTDAGPVGVDVERIVDPVPLGLTGLTLARGESASSPTEFFTLWCRKESVVKATGDGMRVPLNTVTVSAPADAPRLLGYPSGGVKTRSPRLFDLPVKPGYAGALAVLGGTRVEPRIHPVP